MKYIIYEYCPTYGFIPSRYERHELNTDEELKEFLFKRQDNLKNIEIFNKSNKCEIKFEVYIKSK